MNVRPGTARAQKARILDVRAALTAVTLSDLARRGRHTTIPDGFPSSTMSDGMPRGTSDHAEVEAHADRRGWADTEITSSSPNIPSTKVTRVVPDPTGLAIVELFAAIEQMGAAARHDLTVLRHAPPRPVPPGTVTGAVAHVFAAGVFAEAMTDDVIDRACHAGSPELGWLDAVDRAARRAGMKLAYVVNVGAAARGRVSSLAGQCGACSRDVAGTERDRLTAGYCTACYESWQRTTDHRGVRQDRHRFERERRQQLKADEEGSAA